MPRRSILSAAERNSLLETPTTQDNLIRRYAFDERDLSIIRQHRRPENRLGFAVHLCYMRFPGVILGAEEMPSTPLLRLVADQIDVPMEAWERYAQRAETRREHLLELQTAFGFTTFTTTHHYRSAIESLDGVVSRNRRNFRHPNSSPATRASRSIVLPSLWKV
jgi:TnpA family transposase